MERELIQMKAAQHEGKVVNGFFKFSHNFVWKEYQTGLGGRKPAKLLGYSERGRVKQRCHRQKVVWDLNSGLGRQGLTANAAINPLYSVYGAYRQVYQK
jgi:hypothetical protein